MNVKKSKMQRKYVNQMRAMGDVPWPARKFKYPPTFGNQRTYATYPSGRLARYMRRAEEVTARLLDAQGELERRQQESKRAVDAARKQERRARMSPRAIVGRLFNREEDGRVNLLVFYLVSAIVCTALVFLLIGLVHLV